ncbi:hypothetical protein GG496_000225 [Candidatus Fervidibacteria bacterium JGI MDM2 JNZ-1-D12]
MVSEVLKWFASNWLTLLSVALTVLGTILTFIGYQRTRRASEALELVHAYRDAFRIYESALKAYWNSHKHGRKLALSAIDELLAECERYRKRFKNEGLQSYEWEELIEWVWEARSNLVSGKAGDYHKSQENLAYCATILRRLIGSLESKLDQLAGGRRQ